MKSPGEYPVPGKKAVKGLYSGAVLFILLPQSKGGKDSPVRLSNFDCKEEEDTAESLPSLCNSSPSARSLSGGEEVLGDEEFSDGSMPDLIDSTDESV